MLRDLADENRVVAFGSFKTQVVVVRLGDTTAARFAFEPGWKSSEYVNPTGSALGKVGDSSAG